MSIFYTVSIEAKMGGYNGGGANKLEGQILEQELKLHQIIADDDSNTLNQSEKDQLLKETTDSNIQMDYSEIESGIKTDNVPYSKIIINPITLEKVQGPFNNLKVLNILIIAHSKHFSNEFEIKDKLFVMLNAYLKIPELSDLNSTAFNAEKSGDELDNCRDKIKVNTNAHSGELTVSTFSSGTCLKSSWAEKQDLSFKEEDIKNANINYKCKKNTDNVIECVPLLNRDSDLTNCSMQMIGKLQSVEKRPQMLINELSHLEVKYVWCDLVGNTIYKRTLIKIYGTK